MAVTGFRETKIYGTLGSEASGVAERINPTLAGYNKVAGGLFQDFSGYTDHCEAHIYGVMDNIWEIFSKGRALLKILERHELEMLLKATILHDSGIIRTKNDPKSLKPEEIREKHHLRSKPFIKKNYRELGLEKNEADYVGEIVAAHRLGYSLEDVKEKAPLIRERYRLRLLAAVLRLADELDVTSDRTSALMGKVFHREGESELYHRLARDNVGVMYDEDMYGISISNRVTYVEEKPHFESLNLKIQKVFESVKGIFIKYGVPTKRIDVYTTLDETLETDELNIKKALLDGPLSKDEIAAIENIDAERVSDVVSGLKIEGIICEIKGKFHINNEYKVFKRLARGFLGNKDLELDFVSSEYVSKNAKPSLERELSAQYGFGPEETKDFGDRIIVSPTALRWFLFDERVEAADYTFNPENKRGQFFAILLAGFSTDIVFHPRLCNRENLSYFNDLANTMRVHLGSFFSFVEKYHTEKHVSFPPPPFREGAGKISLKFSAEKGRPVTDITKLLYASQKTRQPLHAKICEASIEDATGLKTLKSEKGTDIYATIGLPIMPVQEITRKMFSTFKVGGANNEELQLWLIEEYSKECYDENYLLVRFTAEKNKSAKISIHFPDYVDVGYFLTQVNYFTSINKGVFRNAAIISSTNNATLDYGPISKLAIPELSDLEDDSLEIFSRLDEIPGRPKIPLPHFINDKQRDYLERNKFDSYDLNSLVRLKAGGYYSIRRILLIDDYTGIRDVELHGYERGVLVFSNEEGLEKSTLDIFEDYRKEYGKETEAASSKFYVPLDANEVFDILKEARDNKSFVEKLNFFIKMKGPEERKSLLYLVVYPGTDMFWFDGQTVDLLCISISRIHYLDANSYYFLNVHEDLDKALRFLDEWQEIEPNSYFVFAQKGWAYLSKGEFERGSDYLRKAETYDEKGEGGTYLFNLGLYYLIKNDRDSAIGYYKRALFTENWEELLPLAIQDVKNFINKGFIERSVAQPILRNLESLKSGTVRKNDYCPCWSGKKYKKCHRKMTSRKL